jgi:hypothetical protein
LIAEVAESLALGPMVEADAKALFAAYRETRQKLRLKHSAAACLLAALDGFSADVRCVVDAAAYRCAVAAATAAPPRRRPRLTSEPLAKRQCTLGAQQQPKQAQPASPGLPLASAGGGEEAPFYDDSLDAILGLVGDDDASMSDVATWLGDGHGPNQQASEYPEPFMEAPPDKIDHDHQQASEQPLQQTVGDYLENYPVSAANIAPPCCNP